MTVKDLVNEINRKRNMARVHQDSLRGAQGHKGEQGPPGKDGRDGKDGKRGLDGLDGLDGSRGPRGVAGPRGPKGEQGPPGADGTNGKNGRDGRDGTDGLPGLQGIQGPPGADGRDGRDGLDGDNAPVIVKMEKDGEDHLIIYLDNGDVLKGPKLPEGPKGEQGVVRQMGGGGGGGKAFVVEALKNYNGSLTTKGDILVYDGTVVARLGVGADGQTLVVDSSSPTGLAWGAGSGDALPVSYTYNADGSLATKVEANGTTTYTYNADGTLASRVKGSETINYGYNASGQLISKEAG